jgi:hypothetical protein
LWRITFYIAVSDPNGVPPVLPATRATGPIGHDVCVEKRHVAETSSQQTTRTTQKSLFFARLQDEIF